MSTTQGTWVAADGYTYTDDELSAILTENYGPEGEAWHVRLDGLAVLAGRAWAGGEVLAERPRS